MTLSNYPSGHPTGAVATARSLRSGSVRIGLKPSTRTCCPRWGKRPRLLARR